MCVWKRLLNALHVWRWLTPSLSSLLLTQHLLPVFIKCCSGLATSLEPSDVPISAYGPRSSRRVSITPCHRDAHAAMLSTTDED